MPLSNCKFNLILTWSANYVIADLTGVGIFALSDTKFYLLVVTLST